MTSVLLSSALWAALGGFVYAGGRLATALWGGREITPDARRLAVAQFGLSMVLAPSAGAAITEIALARWPEARLAATALVVGLMVNAVTSVITEPTFIRDVLAALLRGAADRLNGVQK